MMRDSRYVSTFLNGYVKESQNGDERQKNLDKKDWVEKMKGTNKAEGRLEVSNLAIKVATKDVEVLFDVCDIQLKREGKGRRIGIFEVWTGTKKSVLRIMRQHKHVYLDGPLLRFADLTIFRRRHDRRRISARRRSKIL
uniref:NTR domain-containing protein n=1 Tax=Rhabditophanes sp. KR3021 TaxID=114890 RepID=A0AC35UB57_9BILA